MTKLIIILLSAVFINNYVLSRFLGICPFLGVSKKLDSATGMSLAVIFVMLMATAVTWPIQTYLLTPSNLGYLQTIVFILVIAALVQLVEIVLKRYIPSLHKSLGVYLPLITTNCSEAVWASSWLWLCSRACAQRLRAATFRKALRDFPLLWLRRQLPRCHSSASAE